MQQYEPDFRAHHILCTSLYEGKGYSGAFCRNMTRVVNLLRGNPDIPLRLVAGADLICADCPNHDGAGHCTQNGNHVAEKDRDLIALLRLKEGDNYTYRQLSQRAREYLTESFFEASCGNCEWKQQGLCDYAALMERLSELYDQT